MYFIYWYAYISLIMSLLNDFYKSKYLYYLFIFKTIVYICGIFLNMISSRKKLLSWLYIFISLY